ncbi:uncharacterized protein B0I36DRAFT_319254 [Microdochium trichocladiopsis]|uniref:Uncharacterized protein n=1 Tax=Microdochium trichocladiopsis TaxID=1682393 RepID=A0A9P8YCQ6_9PEZI|nr:uncharacterized protein B0I36DRAFT_319254 [Microdochium trichocladiopsis]KAH7035872.1 hypothetical protein B0I36DRAFT_319254 [Microdochium trichocladiopsis]
METHCPLWLLSGIIHVRLIHLPSPVWGLHIERTLALADGRALGEALALAAAGWEALDGLAVLVLRHGGRLVGTGHVVGLLLAGAVDDFVVLRGVVCVASVARHVGGYVRKRKGWLL